MEQTKKKDNGGDGKEKNRNRVKETRGQQLIKQRDKVKTERRYLFIPEQITQMHTPNPINRLNTAL